MSSLARTLHKSGDKAKVKSPPKLSVSLAALYPLPALLPTMTDDPILTPLDASSLSQVPPATGRAPASASLSPTAMDASADEDIQAARNSRGYRLNLGGSELDEDRYFPRAVLDLRDAGADGKLQAAQTAVDEQVFDDHITKAETDSLLRLRLRSMHKQADLLTLMAPKIFKPLLLVDLQQLLGAWPDAVAPITVWRVHKDAYWVVFPQGPCSQLVTLQQLGNMLDLMTEAQSVANRGEEDNGASSTAVATASATASAADTRIWDATMHMAALVEERHATECRAVFPEKLAVLAKQAGPRWQDWIDAMVGSAVRRTQGGLEAQVLAQAAVNTLGRQKVAVHLFARAMQRRYSLKITRRALDASVDPVDISHVFWRMAMALALTLRVYDTQPLPRIYDRSQGPFALRRDRLHTLPQIPETAADFLKRPQPLPLLTNTPARSNTSTSISSPKAPGAPTKPSLRPPSLPALPSTALRALQFASEEVDTPPPKAPKVSAAPEQDTSDTMDLEYAQPREF